MNTLSIKTGKFRLTNISRIGVECVDVKEGVAVEKESRYGWGWYVIAFVLFNENEGAAYYKSVGTRLTTNVDTSEWSIVKELLECGARIVEAANREIDD